MRSLYSRIEPKAHSIDAPALSPTRYGQLGCSGFIISDPNGYFVSRKTKAYLQYGEEAFRHVEDVLRKNLFVEMPSVSTFEEKKSSEGDILGSDWALPSVGVSSMDREHEDCEEALSLLLRSPTVQTLTVAMEVLTQHFQHEERLMKESGFGRPQEKFSPYANHVTDHERILDVGYVELAKHQQPNASFLAMSCSETSMDEPHKSFLSMTCSDTQDGSV